MLYIFLGIIALAIAWGLVKVTAFASKAQEAALASREAQLRSLSYIEGFTPTIAYNGLEGGCGLAIDPATNRFAISFPGGKPRAYRFDQLIAAEVEKDGETITTTKGKVDMSGAAVATALVGPLGLLAGAKTSSTSTSHTRTTKLALKLYVSDLHMPCVEVQFLHPAWFEGSIQFANALKEVDAWYGRFRTIIAGNQVQGNASAMPITFEPSEPMPITQSDGWLGRTFGA